MKKYYKVVSTELQSATARYYTKLRVQYVIGKFVRAPFDSGLFVFDSLDNAQIFINGLYSLTFLDIYEVEVKDPIKILFHFNRSSLIWVAEVVNILKRKKNKKKYLDMIDDRSPPLGTLCFKQVKLIRRVR